MQSFKVFNYFRMAFCPASSRSTVYLAAVLVTVAVAELFDVLFCPILNGRLQATPSFSKCLKHSPADLPVTVIPLQYASDMPEDGRDPFTPRLNPSQGITKSCTNYHTDFHSCMLLVIVI